MVSMGKRFCQLPLKRVHEGIELLRKGRAISHFRTTGVAGRYEQTAVD
jgi:hypothetical protein